MRAAALSFQEIAAQELARDRATERASARRAGLAAFIPALSPRYAEPLHLAPLVERLEAARTEPVRLVVSTPPRHAKTETILHALAWGLAGEPHRTSAYVSYAAEVARSKSRKARMLALTAGVPLADDASKLEEWRTTEGGGVLATGIGGPLTGHGIDGLLVVDDPVKNRVEAESALMRERHWEWFNDVAYTRLEPGGSVIVVMARWHPDDLAGRLVRQGWEYLNLQALVDGRALWPGRWPAEKLEEIHEQIGPYAWASLYMGQPRVRGSALFHDVTIAETLPTSYALGFGVDLAYSAKTRADYSVGIVLAKAGDEYTILDVVRRQEDAPAFKATLRARWSRYPSPRARWYASTTEKGVADLMSTGPGAVTIDYWQAVTDKFVRAQPVAAAWNAGKVKVPKDAPWADAFLDEVRDFTGVNDAHDDQVDALAAAFDSLANRHHTAAPPDTRTDAQKLKAARLARLQKRSRAPWFAGGNARRP